MANNDETMALAWRFHREGADLLNEVDATTLATLLSGLLVTVWPKKTREYRVDGVAAAREQATHFVLAGRWFVCEPHPGDVFIFTVKDE